MGAIRVIFLWHMHQPYYKDLVTGECRLPWVRLHALKDYYGMVKLLDEFPAVHQTFNLVPSLMAQIGDCVGGEARDPFLEVAAKPAGELTQVERRFALTYLFQANAANMIARYPRYQELWAKFHAAGEDAQRAERYFSAQELTDVQVLSQLAWFDEFFLEQPEIAALVAKGNAFSLDDQRSVIAKERELVARVLPAYQVAAERGGIEISTSPFYHPILPLVCDTDQGRVSAPGLALPQQRFRHPEDAREQLRRGLDLHAKTFGRRPRGVWPSEGSVSDEVIRIGHEAGVEWMATDEGVLARSLGASFHRGAAQRLNAEAAAKLYTLWRFEQPGAEMHLVFRDHALSDLIGFVYAKMPAREAAEHFIQSIKEAAQPVVTAGKDAVIAIILDGENAWEYYPRSGREFLRYVYERLGSDAQIEPLTVSEAITRQREFGVVERLTPGSWINANFNVWIGAPEDNKAWDALAAARERYAEVGPSVAAEQRALAYEELLIAEGSDWNWWYGPEHHSANDRDFDELYRKHLSNAYQALGESPPDSLAQPIAAGEARPYLVPQTAYVRPTIDGESGRYFEWIGAAMYTADRRSSAMHGRQYLLDAFYAGVDEENLYGRADFVIGVPRGRFELKMHCETAGGRFQLRAQLDDRALTGWKLTREENHTDGMAVEAALEVALRRTFEFKLPLAAIGAAPGSKVAVRCTLWRDHLPVDAMPAEGAMEVAVVSEAELAGRA